MNWFSPIHHHLFAAALGNEERAAHRTGREQEWSRLPAMPALASGGGPERSRPAPLDANKPMAAGAARVLRVSVDPATA